MILWPYFEQKKQLTSDKIYQVRLSSYKLLVFLLIKDCDVNETRRNYLLRTQHAAC